MMQFRIPYKCVKHGSQLENRVSDSQRIHVDQKDFIILKLHVFRVVVSVDHVVLVRHCLYHG